MRIITVLSLLLIFFGFVNAQNEQAPMTEKTFAYKDWKYKNLDSDGKTDLREFLQGKKLVMVVYWAPWCHNWEHDVIYVESLYEKYKDRGLAIIGVGEYDTKDKMKAHVAEKKLTFPMVYETDNGGTRLKSDHYTQRTAAGDTRRWGSPWYVFLDPSEIQPEGDVLTNKAMVVNGELKRADVEKYLLQKLGQEPRGAAIGAGPNAAEICNPEKPTAALIKP